jgi:hypothetical protein
VKTFAVALAAGFLLSACATTGSGSKSEPAKTETYEVADPIRLALQPVSIPPELEGGSTAPQMFETMLCNRLFALNKGQVMCADAVKAFIETKRQNLVLGSGEESSMDALLQNLDAPRRASLVAAKAGDVVVVTVIVQDKGGTTLDRFDVSLKLDGADLLQRADEAALKIVKIPAAAAK